MKDYYALLGVERGATKSEIKKNYRILAAKYHPDKSKDESTVEKFIAITEAYDVLSNKKSRVKYDLFRWEQQKRAKESADAFNIVVPPFESTRTRRNKSQKIRSLKYHKSTSESEKSLRLLIEIFYIVSRYFFQLIGVTLLLVILVSATGHLSNAIGKNIIRGAFVGALILGIAYLLYWVLTNVLEELKKDVVVFSTFYKITQKKASSFLLFLGGLILIIYITILKVYF